MIKFKKFVRNNIKFFVGIIFGIILSIGTSFAATIIYDSDEVRYDNTTSGMTSTDVQAALDELYARRPQGDASDSKVLSGYTFSNATASGIAGTMPDNSTRTSNGNVPGINSNYPNVPTREGTALQMETDTNGVSRINISPPTGYYPGPGTSYVNRPASDFGNAAANHVLSGEKFTSTAGINVSGSMKNWTGTPQAIDAVRLANNRFEVAVARGYHDYSWAGNSYEYLTYTQVANTIGLTAAKIVKGNTILGIAGTAAPAASRVKLWSGTATGNVSVNLSGYSWVYIVTTGASGNNGSTPGSGSANPTSITLLQVGGATQYAGRVGQAGGYGSFGTSRGYKATTSGITATTNSFSATESNAAITLVIKEVWGIKNLS